jgi:WD40 repeat protein
LKDGNVYLEKPDGGVVPVPLERLSKQDLDYLASLPKYREHLSSRPMPNAAARPKLVQIKVDNESHVGEIRRFPDLGWGVKSLEFSPNGGLLAVGKMDRALMVFDLNTSTRVSFHEKLEGLGQVTCLAFTPDGRKLLTGGYSGRIQIWDVAADGQLAEAGRFVGHSKEILTITVSNDGKMVLSGGAENLARCWNLESAREEFAIDGFRGRVKATYFSLRGKQGLACDGETLALIDVPAGKVIQTMKLHAYSAHAVSIAPDGSRVIVSTGSEIRMWEIRTGREFPPLADPEIQWTARFSPDSKYLISGERAKINLWEVETSRKIYEFDTAGTSYVQSLAYSPDRRHISGIPDSAGQTLQVFRLPADLAR